MFELPECVTLARQINATLVGKEIRHGELGNRPHRFVWYNRSHEEFQVLVQGKTLGEARSKGKWLFIPLEPGYVLLLGEFGGKLLYHPPGTSPPKKYHLWIAFDDGSDLTAMTSMWGAMELYEAGQEQQREYVKDMRVPPLDPGFSFDYFCGLIEVAVEGKKRSGKSFLTQDQLIPGLGNAIAQDILFKAQLHPKHDVKALSDGERRALYESILTTVQEVIKGGGRYDEVDLYGNPGGYVRLMDKEAVGTPCPRCGVPIEKIQYLGGACYFCPACQA